MTAKFEIAPENTSHSGEAERKSNDKTQNGALKDEKRPVYGGMARILPILALLLTTLLTGCLTSSPGGMGSVTVNNTNVMAIVTAAQSVFAAKGYSVGPGGYPQAISFEKPAGAFGKLMYGSYGVTTTVRVQITITQLAGNNYQLTPKVYRVSDAGQAGFESSQRMLGLFSGEFGPLLKQVQAQAANAGPGY